MSTTGQLSDHRGLRTRLIVASIGVAVVVSAISILVAYRLAVDLGQSIELRAIENQADTLLSQLSVVENSVAPELLLRGLGMAHNREEPKAPVTLKLKIRQQEFLQQGIDKDVTLKIQASPEYSANSSGVSEVDGIRYLWVERSNAQTGIAVMLLRYPVSLDQALQYVARRLSVTAFLTFWLAAWGALLASAFIVKRVQKNNEMLTHMATHDALTDLPNRLNLIEQVENYTSSKKSIGTMGPNQPEAALLLIDLDRFKEVNDTLGHAMGDDLLIALSRRFREILDPSQLLVRIGGDEFIVWCPDLGIDDALLVAANIIKACRQPVEVNHTTLEVGASIGISSFPENGDDADTLVRCADIAMYQAKRTRQGVRLYDLEDDTHTMVRVQLSSELRGALEQGQFVLHYQPKVNLATQRIKGVEALARWQHPNLGLIQPMDFIDLVEQSGRVNEFSYYVIRQAVKQIRRWKDQGLSTSVAVNLSPYNLADAELIPYIGRMLDKYQVPAELLELELTESASMLDIETTRKVFTRMKDLGVMLSIDDFGTGMSSLAYLKELDVDYIKIDRSFVMNMDQDDRDEAIVSATINLISRIGRQVIAEGIETQGLAKKLNKMGCKYGQGYYFAKPMPEHELTKLLPHRLPLKQPEVLEYKKSLASR